jgi:hypothetical protein
MQQQLYPKAGQYYYVPAYSAAAAASKCSEQQPRASQAV